MRIATRFTPRKPSPTWTLADTLAGIPHTQTAELEAALLANAQCGMPRWAWSADALAVEAAIQAELTARQTPAGAAQEETLHGTVPAL